MVYLSSFDFVCYRTRSFVSLCVVIAIFVGVQTKSKASGEIHFKAIFRFLCYVYSHGLWNSSKPTSNVENLIAFLSTMVKPTGKHVANVLVGIKAHTHTHTHTYTYTQT